MPLHEQAQAFVDSLAQQPPPGWETLSPADARAAFDGLGELFGSGPDLERIEDLATPGGVRFRLYAATGESSLPVLLFFHGGGWFMGSVQTHDAMCRRLAQQSRCAVVSVDYRLSPECGFPGPLDDCYAVLTHVAEHSAKLNVDGSRLAVVGDSAGGSMAAAVALMARDRNGPAIRLQVLLYPVIEPNFQSESYRSFETGYGLTRAAMEHFWKQYLGDQSPSVLSAVSTASTHADLPDAHVVTAEYDVLRDEGEMYARVLSDAGVPTTLRRYDGMLHGFMHFAGIFDTGIEATSDVAEIVRAKLL